MFLHILNHFHKTRRRDQMSLLSASSVPSVILTKKKSEGPNQRLILHKVCGTMWQLKLKLPKLLPMRF